MWEYQIKTKFVKDNEQLEKEMNEFSKNGWEIFSCVGFQKKSYKDKRGFLQYETEYTIYMKKCTEI